MIKRNGYSVVSEEDYYRELMDGMKAEFPNMSESPSNLLTILARVIARNENMRDYDRVESYSNAYIATATGQHLSKAVRTAGISRLSGTRAVGKVLIEKDSSTPQIVLPANTEIICNDIVYQTINSSAIIINSQSVELEIVSKEVGTINNISIESKFKTVLNIRGVKSIVATTEIEGGSDVESDANLRLRYFTRMSSYANSSLKGIIDRVLAVPEVTKVSGNENNTPNVVDGLLPHSFIIYASGGTEMAIAETIMDTKPAGVNTNGEIETIVDVSGRKHPIRFSRFTDKGIFFSLEVAIDKATANPDFLSILKDKIVEYTNGNDAIIGYELCTFISQSIDEVRGVKTMKFGYEENPTSNDDLIADSGYSFITYPENIEVVII